MADQPGPRPSADDAAGPTGAAAPIVAGSAIPIDRQSALPTARDGQPPAPADISAKALNEDEFNHPNSTFGGFASGFGLTFSTMFKKVYTQQYPFEVFPTAPR